MEASSPRSPLVRFSLDPPPPVPGPEGDPDYSFMSSCSLPSSASPSPPPGSPEAGRVLRVALAHYFSTAPGEDRGAPALCSQVKAVFDQLDTQHQGTVLREDFEALCSVLGLASAPPPSPSTGLPWLATYSPGRPGTPASPLHHDRLGEVELPSPGKSSTSFLWTLGPRPFWELWPAKRGRRKLLSLGDFSQRLLEQWAATYRLPLTLIDCRDLAPNWSGSRGKVRPVQRARSRRRGLVERLARRGREQRGGAQVVRRDKSTQRAGVERTSLFRRLAGGGAVVRLQEKVQRNQEELASLTETVHHIRQSLHLSEAQNLGLQVLLAKTTAVQHVRSPPPPSLFRQTMERSSRQLEHLVAELRGMSQTLPTLEPSEESVSSGSHASPGGPPVRTGGSVSSGQRTRDAVSRRQTSPEGGSESLLPPCQTSSERDNDQEGRHRQTSEKDDKAASEPGVHRLFIERGREAASERHPGLVAVVTSQVMVHGGQTSEHVVTHNTRSSSGDTRSSSGNTRPSCDLVRECPQKPDRSQAGGLSQKTVDSYEALLETELEIQRLRWARLYIWTLTPLLADAPCCQS